jgi:predicted histidine transporter YuiF (NhaC family)
MDFLSIFVSILLGVATIGGFWLAFKNVKDAVIGSLAICIVSLIIAIIVTSRKNKAEVLGLKKRIEELNSSNQNLKKENADYNCKLVEAEKKIDALGIQNQRQREKIRWIRQFWEELNTVFLNAIQGTKRERFEEAYKLYLCKTVALFDDHKEDI